MDALFSFDSHILILGESMWRNQSKKHSAGSAVWLIYSLTIGLKKLTSDFWDLTNIHEKTLVKMEIYTDMVKFF